MFGSTGLRVYYLFILLRTNPILITYLLSILEYSLLKSSLVLSLIFIFMPAPIFSLGVVDEQDSDGNNIDYDDYDQSAEDEGTEFSSGQSAQQLGLVRNAWILLLCLIICHNLLICHGKSEDFLS